MQEFFLNLKPKNLTMIAIGQVVLLIILAVWPVDVLTARLRLYMIAIFLIVAWSWGWHFVLRSFLLDKCKVDFGFVARYHKSIAFSSFAWWTLMLGLWILSSSEWNESNILNLETLLLYPAPIHILSKISGIALTNIELKVLVAVEDQVSIESTDIKTTKKQVRSILGLAKIQRRVQAIRDRDPMRQIYSSGPASYNS